MTEHLNPDFLAFDEDYQTTMEGVILPYLAACRKEGSFSGAGNRPMYYARYDADSPRGTVVLVHGFTENEYKYAELIHSLVRSGFSVLAYDQRGHGRSWKKPGLRHHSDTHVDAFSEYVEDLKCLTNSFLSAMPQPWSVFCHSMGGAVTALFLEQYPDVFSRAAMCAPMIAPNLGGLSESAAALLCRTQKLFGRSSRKVAFSQPYSGPEDFATSAASDPVRFAWYDAVKAARREFQNSSPTYGWTLEAISVTKKILDARGPEDIACPVLLSTAAEDGSVLPGPQKLFISRVRRGTHLFVEGARHEIYRSPDAVLHPWWHTQLAFLSGDEVSPFPERA